MMNKKDEMELRQLDGLKRYEFVTPTISDLIQFAIIRLLIFDI